MKRKNVSTSNAEVKEKRKDDIQGFLGSVQNDINVMSGKRRKLSKKDLLKPPTNEELNQLRETENLFHSNLFRLQIEELFAEIKIRDRYVNLIKEWLLSITKFLDGLENSEPSEISCEKWQKTLKVKVPIEQPAGKVKGVFLFVKPAAVNAIGSYESGCSLGPNTNLDLLLLMPKKCFQRSDSLNHKYFYKRALYLAHVAAQLKKSKLVEEMKFRYAQGNPLRPVLDLKPVGKLGKRCIVTIHLAPPLNCFKRYLFSPSRSNVRENWFFNQEDSAVTEGGPPTPHYNSSILVDLTMQENEEIRCNTLLNNNNLKDGIKLLKIWLHQRELDEGYGAFSAYIMSMYVVYLAKERRISNLMSSYQVIRTAWNCLATSDWTTNGISLAQIMKVKNPITIENFHQNFEVVFVDGTGFNNLCANVSKYTFIRVMQECQLAVNCLDNPNLNSFQALFMTKIPFYRQFDHIISFHNPTVLEGVVKKYSSKEEMLNHGINLLPLALKLLLTKVSRATQRRTTLLAEKLSPSIQWDVSEAPPLSWTVLVLGIALDPETAFDVIEKGPSANTPEAEEFRTFWGSKSELRRFQDGSVCEAVLWGDSNARMSQRRTVCKLAIGHILKSIGLEEGSSWLYLADQLESLVRRFGLGLVSVEEECLAVVRATNALSTNLRQLKGLPLDVTSVAGLSPVHRYSDPFSPVPSNLSVEKHGGEKDQLMLIGGERKEVCRWLPQVEVIIQLGISSKWPSTLEAIRRVKAAFHLKIAESLEEQFKLKAQAYPEFIDLFQDGYVFRIYLACPREISLLKESQDTDGMVKYKSTEESTAMEKRTTHLPKLSSALHGLQQSFGAFGATCCLAKRWVASHLLLSNRHLPEICVELLVASLFLSPEPLVAPNQPQAAFLRFLNLVASRDWSSQLLILNLNDEMSRQDILAIENNFGNSDRTTLPPLVIATPYDHTGDIWTKESPSVQILVRLAHLASKTLGVIEGKLYTRALIGFKQVFRPLLDPYDLVLHLYPQMVPRIKEAIDPILVNKKKKAERGNQPPLSNIVIQGNLPPVAFDPVEFYLKELQDGYGEYALFFHDCYGGNFIGVLWKPVAFEEKDVKVSHFNCRKLNSEKSKLLVNFDAIIEDFYVLGKGLVSNIAVKFKSKG